MGLYDQINNSKLIEYNKLTKDKLQQCLNEINHYKVRNVTMTMSRMSYIHLCINLPNSRTNKDIINSINKLFKWLYCFQKIQDLHDLKDHHIKVGYSKMTTIELNCKIRELYVLRTITENKIEELYYGKKNNI